MSFKVLLRFSPTPRKKIIYIFSEIVALALSGHASRQLHYEILVIPSNLQSHH